MKQALLSVQTRLPRTDLAEPSATKAAPVEVTKCESNAETRATEAPRQLRIPYLQTQSPTEKPKEEAATSSF